MPEQFDAAAAVDGFLADQTAGQLKTSMALSSGAKPDFVAESRKLSQTLGLPPQTVEGDIEDSRRRAALETFDAAGYARDFPNAAKFMADPQNAAIAHDDTQNLGGVDAALSAIGAAARYITSADDKGGLLRDMWAGVHGANRGAAGVFQAGAELAAPLLDPLAGTILPENPLRRIAASFAEMGSYSGQSMKELSPAKPGIVAGGVSSGVQSLTQNMMLLPLAFLPGGQPAALAGMAGTQGGQSYQDAREQGIPVQQAIPFATSQAAIEYATEKIPMHRLLGDLASNTSLSKTLMHQIASEVPGEEVATVLQDANEWAILHPEKTFKDYLDERPSAAAQTLIATIIGVGGNVAVMRAVDGAVNADAKRQQAAQQAEFNAQAMEHLTQLTAASKLRERAPDSFEQFVTQATQDGPVPDVYIDANVLAQSGVAEQVAAVSPAVAEQLQTALATGGDIRIPVADFATNIAPTDYAQSLLDHLKTDPNGMSRAEAQEYMQSHAEQLQQEVENALADQQGDATFKASADAVKAEVKTQLDQAGRFTDPVNDAYASMVGNFYAVMGARLGLSPQDLFARYPLQVAVERIAGGRQLDQAPTLGSLQAAWADAGIKATVSESADRITLSQIVVPEAERGKGAGTAAMQQLVQYADAVGKHIVLSPSSDFGGNKKRLTAFYKRFGFVENKGRNRAFSTMESMYRTAPGKVLEQNKAGARGAFNPATNTITLLKNADLSTFLHESGHFFLEAMTDMASREDAPQAVKDDAAALMKWFGLRDLDEWQNLDFEEKRSYHEQFARGFEAYLFEGKSPSIGMQGLFQRFRAWMLNVYKELKALNVELTDEVREVFDRMLASTEEIKLAEQGRSMMPLFTSPEQAGMTPEEFAAYQALGVDATNDAIQDLQARGLRDMQWIQNAKGREVARLKKESAARRAEVEMGARREVMSQPIYRAWQFLTGKPKTVAAEQTPEQAAHKDVVAEWEKQRAEATDVAREKAKRDAWENSDEARREYESGRARGMAKGQFLARMKKDIDLVVARAVLDWDRANPKPERPAAQVEESPDDQHYGKFSLEAVRDLGIPAEIVEHLKKLRMTGKDGLHPDVVADLFGFSSGDELVRTLAAAPSPKDEIEALTDQRMLEQYGDLATPEAIDRAADRAIHNDARARMVATEANALAKAVSGKEQAGTDKKGRPIMRAIVPQAAREYARAIINRLKVRDIRPSQYAAAEARAAKAADKAMRAKDLAIAAAEKRNQLVNNYATRAAYDAQEQVEKGLRYLRKFDSESVRKGLDADYTDQVDALLERFDLRKQSLKAIDKRAALAEWLTAQREQGLEPDVPLELQNEAFRKSYKDMTVEEFQGLVDTVKQIEHLGRLKHRLLTAADNRAYEAVRDEIAASLDANANGREANTRTPTSNAGRAVAAFKRFWTAHIKVATWVRVMDGGKDGGPMWEYFVRSANERGDQETTMRANATTELSKILAPIFKLGKMGGSGQFFPTINRSLNREARLAIALNTGNAGNFQRLLGGEGWTAAQIMPVLQSLTADEWRAVQAVWDHFESYRPGIAAKERRVYGKEPAWVEPSPISIATADGQKLELRGGYYPIKYDPAASQRAEEHADSEGAKRQMQGAYTSATTRRSFTKSRVEEVSGRPLLYTLAGLYSGVNDVIHDLAWHEWLIDANRLLRSKTIDSKIRSYYGPEVKGQFKSWAAAIAEGDQGSDAAVDQALSRLRQGVSVAGLGFNAMSAAMQPLGITQSIVRVGAKWIGRGVARYIASPIASTREVNAKSDFMANRARTRFRELNELRNQVQDQSAFKERTGRYAYFLMMRAQQMVDVPTWLGAYEKALAEGNTDERAVALADQAVIDAQGGGQTKDLSAIERGGPAQKLFTVFYSFMNTALNAGVAQTMTADTPAKKARLAADYALLFVVPAVLGGFLKDALTPGGGDDDWEKLARKMLANQIDYLMGLMVVVREFSEAAKTITGANDKGRDYTGPAGLRAVADTITFAKQAHQGEFDDAFRKASINIVGDLFGLPSAQINRTVTGAQALAEGKTVNPAALVFGFQKQ